MLRLEAGNPEFARDYFLEAQEIAGDSDKVFYGTAERLLRLAESHLALAEYPETHKLATQGLDILDKCGDALERGQLLHVKAIAAYFLGNRNEAVELLSTADVELRRVGDRYELGRVLLTRAELISTDPLKAIADATEALTLFQRMEVPHLAARTREAIDLLRLRVPREAPAGSESSPAVADDSIVAESPAMKELLADAKRISRHPGAVLITGETGVGKEVVAKYIHDHSDRNYQPFVPINCAAIPETLFERELFGNAKGAFTDATADRQGLVEYANGGTLFLDEIGEMPMSMQAKLLRLIQEGTYRRVGEVDERTTDIRILAATNRDLSEQIASREFRQDLLYRLRVFELEIPPLRDRPEDILPLTDLFLRQQGELLRNTFWMEKGVYRLLRLYRWPGNVRELEAAIISSAARADEHGCIRAESLPRTLRAELLESKPVAGMSLLEHVASEERRLILTALQRTGNKTDAARLLGISRSTLYKRMKWHGVDEKDPGA